MKGKSANYVVFDIGSNKVAAIATNINKTGESTIIAQVLQYSGGFKASTVVNLEAAENSIIAAIYSLEKECNKSINEVTISLSSGFKSYYINHTLKLGSQPINKQDIKKLKTEYGNMILFFIKKIQPNKPWDILYRLNQ